MTAFTGDIQILLYTEEVDFSACRDTTFFRYSQTVRRQPVRQL